MNRLYLALQLSSLLSFSPALFCQDIFEAVKKGDLVATTSILEKDPGSARTRNANGKTALHAACEALRPALIRLLIDKGADVNAVDSGGKSPLVYAARSVPFGFSIAQDRKDAVRCLVEAGADIAVTGPESVRLIHLAASSGYQELAAKMIVRGVDPNTRNADGGTLLHSAAAGGLATLVDTLLKRRLDPNARNRYGMTPLQVGAALGNSDVVERLVAAGADLNARCPAGKTAMQYAEDSGFKELAGWLRRRGTQPGGFPVVRGDYFGQKRPGLIPEVFASGIISTTFVQHGPTVFAPDGTAVYWSPLLVRDGKPTATILMMSRDRDRWTAPHQVSFIEAFSDCFPALSPDGNRLFFGSNRLVTPDMPPDHRNLWFADKLPGGWSAPRPVGPPVNSGNENTQPTVDRDGDLYFGSARAGGRGAIDLYVSRLVNGKYREPQNLGDAVNTPGLEYSPFVDPSGKYLIFCAGERPDSLGGMDLFVSFREHDGSWSKAVNLGDRINTEGEEYWPAVSPDGKFLFFVSNRNGNFDVYWADAAVIQAVRPKSAPR